MNSFVFGFTDILLFYLEISETVFYKVLRILIFHPSAKMPHTIKILRPENKISLFLFQFFVLKILLARKSKNCKWIQNLTWYTVVYLNSLKLVCDRCSVWLTKLWRVASCKCEKPKNSITKFTFCNLLYQFL